MGGQATTLMCDRCRVIFQGIYRLLRYRGFRHGGEPSTYLTGLIINVIYCSDKIRLSDHLTAHL
jgi:hypothetical protein